MTTLASIINKNAVASDVPYLCALKIDVVHPDTGSVVETLRVVRNNEDITLANQLFVASSFDIKIEESDEELPSASLSVVDITQTIQRFLQEYKGGNGSKVTVYFFFAPTTTVDSWEVDYEFDVINAKSDETSYTVSWTIGATNPLTQPMPARTQRRDRCQWRYKGGECQYSGALPSCDLSLDGANGCRTHNNSARFGGFPGITVRNV